jgi:predicted glutamine amidotransferase
VTLFIHGRATQSGAVQPLRGLHVLPALRRSTAPSTPGLAVDRQRPSVVLAASVPLTAEPGWRPLAEGELVAIRRGAVVFSSPHPA